MAVGRKWIHWGHIKELEPEAAGSNGVRNLNVLERKKELIANDYKLGKEVGNADFRLIPGSSIFFFFF